MSPSPEERALRFWDGGEMKFLHEFQHPKNACAVVLAPSFKSRVPNAYHYYFTTLWDDEFFPVASKMQHHQLDSRPATCSS